MTTLRSKIAVAVTISAFALTLLFGAEAHAQAPAFRVAGVYKHGDQVSLNGTNFTLNVRINNSPHPLAISGTQCAPIKCTRTTPYMTPSGLGAYWVSDLPAFRVAGVYKHGDQVSLNGTSFTLNVRINNSPHPLAISGTQCAPIKCTRTTPYMTPSGLGAYWVPGSP
ncbi:MAG TPA: hypothetical protein VNO30_41035 [Kofleriaceae bacterium]|nr:hypothetical protein [Kofleriaceae bacterium]